VHGDEDEVDGRIPREGHGRRVGLGEWTTASAPMDYGCTDEILLAIDFDISVST
jgi:hypothetical protein